MALDAICLAAVAHELRGQIVGGKIDKIYQPSRRELVFLIRGNGENMRLFLSANPNQPRVHLTKLTRENPEAPPMFCMLLRKHLTGGRVLEIVQPPLERLLDFKIETTNELGDRVECHLIFEGMGRHTNLILLDKEARIVDCINRRDGDLSSKRPMLPGMFYRLPEARFGVPPLLERELQFQGKAEDIRGQILNLLEGAEEGNGTPYLLLRDGKPMDFSFMPILQYGPETTLCKYDTFGQLLDDFFEVREQQEKMQQKGQDFIRAVTSARERTARKLENQRQERLEAGNREMLRQFGDIITSNLHHMQRGMSELNAMNFYDPDGASVTILLNPLLTPQENAAKYYKDYNKAKTAERVLTEQIEKGEGDLAYLNSVLESISFAEREADLQEIRQELTETGYLRRVAKKKGREKKITGKPMEFRSTAGLRISVGKNNSQNDQLTLKAALKSDIWLHTQKIHGSHVILWLEGKAADAQSLTEAAVLAAYFSQGRNGSSVAVDYTPVKYVKKPSGAKPGLVVYTTYQTAYVNPDEELVKKLRVM